MNKELDLNLLKVLVLLNRHKKIKIVAKELGKSEASISKYLTRLREQLNDELFIRYAHHLEPTYELKRRLPEIEEALSKLESCMDLSEFNPNLHEGSITVCLPQTTQYSFGHLILTDLMSLFPNSKIDVTSNIDSNEGDILDDKVDIRLHYFNDELPKTIYQKHIGYAAPCIVVPDELGIDDFEEACKLKFVLLEILGWKDKEQLTKRALEKRGIYINRVATIGNITSLFETIKLQGAATILFSAQGPREGFAFIPIPDELYRGERPKAVLQMKQTNRSSPVHQILTNVILKHINSQR